MAGISRRGFLGATAGAAVVAGMKTTNRVFGANSRVKVGVIGLNGRGQAHLTGFASLRNAEVVAMCDVDERILDERANTFHNHYGYTPTPYTDLRDMLDDEGVEAVSIATPNHWHALATIWACQAGKDVYVEKPLSHSIWEGQQVVEAAAQYERIVQHGAQRRSDRAWYRAMQRLHDGVIGKPYMARVVVFIERGSIGKSKPEDAPEWLNWDLWQGPAKREEYNPVYVHYDWHWFWKYGNGDLGNNGVHFIDIALWALQKGIPGHVYSTGGRFGYEDMGETPNTQIAAFTYEDGTLLNIEVRGRATNREEGMDVGILCYGSDGYMADTRFFDAEGREIPDEIGGLESVIISDNHFQSFIDAVYSRKAEDIHGTALDGHLASSVCHCANIAYRMGRDLNFDPEETKFLMDVRANNLTKDEYNEEFAVPDLLAGA